jgi:hypothetical protein
MSREEIRLNLPKLGVELITNPLPMPDVPDVPEQIPYDDTYPMVELHDVPEAVLAFIEENQVPDEVLAELPPDSFGSVEALVRAIGILASRAEAVPVTSQDGETE